MTIQQAKQLKVGDRVQVKKLTKATAKAFHNAGIVSACQPGRALQGGTIIKLKYKFEKHPSYGNVFYTKSYFVPISVLEPVKD